MLDLEFSGSGEHAYFLVEKTGWNTADVAREVASAYNVAPVAVGFAGRKDKRAVTRQWFSVVTDEDRWLPQLPGVRCLRQARHQRKLRLGQHSANRFELVLREARNCSAELLQSLQQGFANAFGPQRLSAQNVEQAQTWILQRRRRRISRQRSGWHLSVLRAELFNRVLQARCAAGSAATLIEGDVAEDGLPTGPLWGRGRSAASGEALAVEQAALASAARLCEALEFSGVSQARRKLFELPRGLRVQSLGVDCFELQFTLPPGAYATSMLASRICLSEGGTENKEDREPADSE